MNHLQTDYDGHSFAEWLLQLVDHSASKRREASRVIITRFYMLEDLLLQPGGNSEALVTAFGAAVRHALRQPNFPASDYVQKLFTFSMVLEGKRMRAWRSKEREEESWHAVEQAKLGLNPSPAEVRRYLKRVWVRFWRQSQDAAPVDEALETGICITYVIESLGEELLPAAPLIRHMLNETHQSHLASAAICRMGRAALEFYPDIIAGLNRYDPNGYFSKPLGILLRTVPEKIPEVLNFLSSPGTTIRINAIWALGYCGRAALVSFREVEARLLSHIRVCSAEEWFVCASSLGELATTSEAVSTLLEATYPADSERAAASITSLGRIALESDRVVPRLITLLDEFHEFDPDWCYDGDHGRVVDALSRFGEHAAPAIPALIDRIWTKPQQYYDVNDLVAERRNPDCGVIRLLGNLGPASADALPVLLAMKAELIRRCIEEEASNDRVKDCDEASCCPEYLLEAIAKISGSQVTASS